MKSNLVSVFTIALASLARAELPSVYAKVL